MINTISKPPPVRPAFVYQLLRGRAEIFRSVRALAGEPLRESRAPFAPIAKAIAMTPRSGIAKALACDAARIFGVVRDGRRSRRLQMLFVCDTCLINRYARGARVSLHQNRDQQNFANPIASMSRALPAISMFGGPMRSDRPRRYRLEHGDVVVWGGRRFWRQTSPATVASCEPTSRTKRQCRANSDAVAAYANGPDPARPPVSRARS
jgi:hypothetical protein